jgi:hypothetical protein
VSIKNAEDLADIIIEKRFKKKQSALTSLRYKCMSAISKLADSLEFSIEVDVDEADLEALAAVTEELRKLSYKFAFIEVVSDSGKVVNRKLRISVEHLA